MDNDGEVLGDDLLATDKQYRAASKR